MQKFTNPNDPENVQTLAWIQKQASLALETATETISVEELSCNESSCLHATVVIGWSNDANIKYFKIPKPLVFIRKGDIERALKQPIFEKPLHQHL